MQFIHKMTQIDLFYDEHVFISAFKWMCNFLGLKMIKMYMLTFIQGYWLQTYFYLNA